MTDILDAGLLLSWYDTHKRILPWRQTRDPYRIWLSEVMLQQTQVATVIPYYNRFTDAFPDATALADAQDDRVLKMWEGLGYYNRCHNLLKAMRKVRDEHGGRVPDTPEAFSGLPGVGPYTCAAVQSIAFGHSLAAVDGNVNRVVTRLFALDGVVTSAGVKRAIQDAVDSAVSETRPGDFNQAMMELGATVCTPRRPDCSRCPLRSGCKARALGRQEAFPVKGAKKAVPLYPVALAVVVKDGKILVQKRPAKGHLAGMWEFPGGRVLTGETHEDALGRCLMDELGVVPAVGKLVGSVTHAYSHFRVQLYLYLAEVGGGSPTSKKGQPVDWITTEDLNRLAFPTANRKLFPLLVEALG
ncbi:A/G-specific adenine glycosylase [Desulfoluna butyratoxydans]|uniref:Adenine DNA glycosylase n=1 Tax=Desulfoluna butyratoxydans TaxID=231438 RepID=A0A4U8YNT9_9BACT|nr:A/G-specific adenine glycosylase [Desulfoluna butyratoxydans]VFQ45421.1 a/g-specific adenine glycosylase muty [Desulfoluna butyratoxydans]